MSFPPRGHHHHGPPPPFFVPMGGGGGAPRPRGPPPNIPPPAASAAKNPPGFVSLNKDVPTGPPVTVFVGNITERAQDAMMRHLLTTCGPVLSWKRVQGATGKLQAFGFCEYGNPDAGLRAIRILHDWRVADKKLVVKVDAKTKEILDEYKIQRRRRVKGIPPPPPPKEGEAPIEILEKDYMDDAMKHDDNLAKDRINAILQDHSKEMDAYIPKDTDNKTPRPIVQTGPKESLDNVEMEDGKREIIHREIDKFRETMKIREAEKEVEKKKREESRERRMDERERRDREREAKDTERREERRTSRRKVSHSRSRSRSYSPRNRSRGASSRRSHRRSRSRSRNNDRRDRSRTPQRKSQQEVWKEREQEEETKERKKAERKARDKEANYQERLRKWENRESKMAKEYSRERLKEQKKNDDLEKEARKLKEFLEDYDDEKDDEKYYKGRELDRRLHERERESARDSEDRQREKDEVEELKAQMLREGFHGDPTLEIQRRMELRHTRRRQVTTTYDNGGYGGSSPIIIIPPVVNLDDDNDDIVASPIAAEPEEEEEPIAEEPEAPAAPPPMVPPIQLQPIFNVSKPSNASINLNNKKKLDVRDVFNQDDDEVSPSKKRKPLPPITKQKPDENNKTSSEDKRKHIKSLIEKIPTDKASLFAYKVDWDMVDNQLMEKRIRPWVNKKISEYIGEPEPTLTDFICSKVLAGSSPKAVLEDVQMVLDEEAEVFVVKMWRLLIYEIENKKHKTGGASNDR